jgi:hypothetical protein
MAKSRWETPQQIPLDQSSTGPKVFAAGLWRTGTSSLQVAFENHLRPPLRPSMHGTYLLNSFSTMRLTVDACNTVDPKSRQQILRQIFNGYNASSDYPGMAFADDLMELYPDMKIILNKRSSAKVWQRSAVDVLKFWSTYTYIIICGLFSRCRWHWRNYHAYDKLAKRRFGPETDIWSEVYYETHNEWVRNECRKKGRKWLEWEPEDGWGPLCEFLGVDVPQEEFPRVNDASEIKGFVTKILVMGIASWFGLGVSVWAAWWVGRRLMG